MPMYRAITTNLRRIGVMRGEIFNGKLLSPAAEKVLLQKGVIAKVSAPPVAAVPKLKPAAKKLKDAGIETVDEILEADEIEGVEVDEKETLDEIANETLTVKKEKGCSNCS